ncbi:MAG: hypothetical protein QOJ62_1791 [Actinomycetota bacterium]|nr:hypothetical protein [Actinomycetota bacterium]
MTEASPHDERSAPVGRLVLLRHGATDWSASGKHTGRTDVQLSESGERQARRLAASLSDYRFVLALSSPLQRARRTAELAGLTDVQIEPDLVEWDYGGYEGLTTDEIRARRAGWLLWDDGVVPTADGQHGEAASDVAARADRVVRRVLPTVGRGDVAVVSHGHFLRVFTARWLGLEPTAGALFALDTATVSVLGFERERAVIRHWNMPAR